MTNSRTTRLLEVITQIGMWALCSLPLVGAVFCIVWFGVLGK